MRTTPTHGIDMRSLALILCGVLLAPTMAAAARGKPLPKDPANDPLMVAAGFLDHHPDLRHRMDALEAYRARKFERARTLFERAALYADKPSQGMMAEMLWKGEGGAQDRALAYAWMDLAAERGYRPLLVLRERYWKDLGETERAEAVARGGALYARYGDAVAKPRYANVLRRGMKQVTGSRTGFVGNVSIVVPIAGGEQNIDGAHFFNPRYWKPDEYWAWQDAIWKQMRPAVVNVGEPEKVEDAAPAKVKH